MPKIWLIWDYSLQTLNSGHWVFLHLHFVLQVLFCISNAFLLHMWYYSMTNRRKTKFYVSSHNPTCSLKTSYYTKLSHVFPSRRASHTKFVTGFCQKVIRGWMKQTPTRTQPSIYNYTVNNSLQMCQNHQIQLREKIQWFAIYIRWEASLWDSDYCHINMVC